MSERAGKLRRTGVDRIQIRECRTGFRNLSAEQFFRRFPEGVYDVEAKRQDGTEYESEVVITHLMPAPPQGLACERQGGTRRL